VLFGFASCKTAREVTVERVRPISTNKLIRKVEENSFDYKYLNIKRIVVQYDGPDEKTSFRASLKSEKDKQLQVSISKLNFPVARMHLTPDSVKLVNYMEKSYLLEDYDFLSGFVNADLDFEMVQAVISNEAFSYRDDPRDNDFKDFVSYTESGMYILQSLKRRKLTKIAKKGGEEKMDRYLNKLNEENFIVQQLYIDPKTFKIRKILLDDQSNQRTATINFSEFEKVNGQLYPGSIDIKFASQEKDLSIKIKLSKFSTEKDSFSFNVPEKYSRVN
jgi:hypothetical protein